MRVLWITSPENALADNGLFDGTDALAVRIAASGPDGLDLFGSETFEVAVINAPVPGWPSGDLLEELHRRNPNVPVLIRDLAASLDDAVRLTRLGAFHFIERSSPPDQLKALLETAREFGQARAASDRRYPNEARWRDTLVGQSRAMQSTIETIRLLGPRKSTVLISGETGTGKELVARAVHLASARSHLPMVAVNCSALPENLLEAELFGHVKGAFTGAIAQRAGRFEQAARSTLFLDEVAEMALDVQTKLLRVLQEREFQRVGSSETVKADVRVVAACNVDLADRVRQGRFREDLYYRLNVVPIEIPPLRDRPEDIPLLAGHFAAKIARSEGIGLKQMTRETLERLMRYHWPGNVRQLENAVEVAMVLSGERDILYPSDFRLPLETSPRPMGAGAGIMPGISVPGHGLNFDRTVGEIERSILEQALRMTNGNKKQAAEMLGLKRTTLAAKLKSLDAVVG